MELNVFAHFAKFLILLEPVPISGASFFNDLAKCAKTLMDTRRR